MASGAQDTRTAKAGGSALRPASRDWSVRLPAIAAAALLVLLAAFFAVTLNNTMVTTAQIEAMRTGAYPVSVAAGRVETQLVQMRTLADRPIFVRSEEALESIDESFEEIDAELAENIKILANSEDKSATNGHDLEAEYRELVRQQKALVAYCRIEGVNDAQVEKFVDENIQPLIADLLATNAVILDRSTAAVEELYATGSERGSQTVVWAVVLMVAVVVSLFLYLYLLRRRWVQQQQLQRNVEEALQLAQSASEAKSQFLPNMSHDIRTPMNAIVGLTTIASSHVEDPERMRESLDRIATSSKHLLCLINDVLDMSRIESGKIILNEDCFSLPGLVDELATIVQPQAKAKEQRLEIALGAVEHKAVLGDGMRLNQALLNILGNAVKYTPEGGTIQFEIEEGPMGGDGAGLYRFTVADNGIGMSPEFVRHMFDPFEREEKVAVSSTEGTGLGMAITKNVVEMMGGTIEVESAPGVGSTFKVTVPLRPAPENLEEDRPAESRDEGPLEGRVLLVEDNELNRDIAAELIAQSGALVETAVNGAEAVEKVMQAQDGYYDLVFMDMRMPVMGGLEATQTICELARHEDRVRPPIVAMTANAFSSDRAQALAAGMDGFMAKPIDIRELERTLNKYLR